MFLVETQYYCDSRRFVHQEGQVKFEVEIVMVHNVVSVTVNGGEDQWTMSPWVSRKSAGAHILELHTYADPIVRNFSREDSAGISEALLAFLMMMPGWLRLRVEAPVRDMLELGGWL